MIFSELNNLNQYLKTEDYIKIKKFLDNVSPDIDEGKYEIDGEKIYAKVMSYDTKPIEKCLVEAHNKYIDIQASLVGSEGIDVFKRKGLTEQIPYKVEEDVVIYKPDERMLISHVNNIPGYFSMLFPEDAHRPQEVTSDKNRVKKFVIKLAVQEENEKKAIYSIDYFNLISEGLSQVKVTGKKGERIPTEEAIDIWAERARYLQQISKGLIFFCGNGASASMAEHMSHDWFQNACVNTLTCAEISHVTAISNDVSYDDVYSYRVKRVLAGKDILVGISSSGNSQNIVNAVKAANDNGAFTITISGKKPDNKIRQMGDLNFYIPLETYGEVESAHSVLLHMALDYFLDKYMGGRH